jgi:acetate kinase
MKILVVNIGTTSLKYRLYDVETGDVATKGYIERIGQAGNCPNYEAAISQCLAALPIKLEELSAIGFKAVHAGPLTGARIVNDEVLAAMEEFTFLAPAHNPPYIAAMRAFQHQIPSVPLVALFETAFFGEVPERTYLYSVPYEWKDVGIRRYGFHGASHRAASERAQELLGRKDIRHISCHLGGSSSVAAIRNGIAVDCSFGISPQSGIPHNNRSGDVDAYAILYAMKRLNLGIDETAKILASQSGLAGMSGTSGDVRDIEAGIAKGDHRCQLAMDVFVKAIRNYIGAFLIELGGVDVLTFSGGIGENGALTRAEVCKGLEPFGIMLDAAKNAAARNEAKLSADGSKVAIFIVPADEERIVARASAQAVKEMVAA